MTVDTAGPVIILDDEGLVKLRQAERDHERRHGQQDHWERAATRYRLTTEDDGTIILHPISDLEAALWRSGLMAKIEDSRAHPERMIRLDPDEL